MFLVIFSILLSLYYSSRQIKPVNNYYCECISVFLYNELTIIIMLTLLSILDCYSYCATNV